MSGVQYKVQLSNLKKRVFDAIAIGDDFLDAILWAEGSTMKVHRNIVSAASPYFHDLFVSIKSNRKQAVCMYISI